MPVDMTALAADLAAESAVTRALVAGLDEAGWHTPTPAAGWDIADQISHLAYFDEVTVQSALDPEQFKAGLAEAEASGGVNPDTIAVRFRDRSGAQLLAWFDAARDGLSDPDLRRAATELLTLAAAHAPGPDAARLLGAAAQRCRRRRTPVGEAG